MFDDTSSLIGELGGVASTGKKRSQRLSVDNNRMSLSLSESDLTVFGVKQLDPNGAQFDRSPSTSSQYLSESFDSKSFLSSSASQSPFHHGSALSSLPPNYKTQSLSRSTGREERFSLSYCGKADQRGDRPRSGRKSGTLPPNLSISPSSSFRSVPSSPKTPRVRLRGGLRQIKKKMEKTFKSTKGNGDRKDGSNHSPLHGKINGRGFLVRQPSLTNDRLVSVSEATPDNPAVLSRPFRLSTSSHIDMVSANVVNKVFNILTFWVKKHFEVRKYILYVV